MNRKKITVEDLLKDEGAVEAILFKQGSIINSIRVALGVDEGCPTELIPDIIESTIKENKKLREQIKQLEKKLNEETRRD